MQLATKQSHATKQSMHRTSQYVHISEVIYFKILFTYTNFKEDKKIESEVILFPNIHLFFPTNFLIGSQL